MKSSNFVTGCPILVDSIPSQRRLHISTPRSESESAESVVVEAPSFLLPSFRSLAPEMGKMSPERRRGRREMAAEDPSIHNDPDGDSPSVPRFHILD